MPVSKTCDIESLGERNYKISWPNALTTTIRDVLSSPNPFFTESQVTVVERLIINTTIEDFNIVDADYNWADTHYYIGNWQVASWEGGYSGTSENEGYITRTTTIIEKFSTITIAADPNRLGTIGSNIRIEQCNLELVPELKIYPPILTPVVSYQVKGNEPILQGFLQRVPSQLQEQTYQPKISGCLIGLRPGCTLFSASYFAGPVNNVFVADPAYELPTCSLPDKKNCDEILADFIANNNAGRDPSNDPGLIFTNQASCEDAYGACREEIFNCPGEGGTRSYWVINAV